MHQVPGHEGGVPLGAIIVQANLAVIALGGAWSRLADPAGVGLGRDDIAEVLQGITDAHRAVSIITIRSMHPSADSPTTVTVTLGFSFC